MKTRWRCSSIIKIKYIWYQHSTLWNIKHVTLHQIEESWKYGKVGFFTEEIHFESGKYLNLHIIRLCIQSIDKIYWDKIYGCKSWLPVSVCVCARFKNRNIKFYFWDKSHLIFWQIYFIKFSYMLVFLLKIEIAISTNYS